ncbi:MAG TPA: PilZ domain-containing protein [Bryobacteraceae bacterium]|nr:PilZ domain-containing protein [Bryobacteraceae bacterium]
MKSGPEERRRATRFPIEARVNVRASSGRTFTATAVNISTSGMLLQVPQPFPLSLGEEVTVEVNLPGSSGQAVSVWGLAKVVRLDGLHSAVQLSAGSFELYK